MSKYLPATLGIAAMLIASTALANEVLAPVGGKVAEQLQFPPFNLPTNHFVPMPTGPFVSLNTRVAEVLPPIASAALKLEMLMAQVDSFDSRTAQWGLNPMEGAMKGEISTVGGPASEGDAIDFAVLNREGLSRMPFYDSRAGGGGGEAWMPAPDRKSEISGESKAGGWGPGGDLDMRFAIGNANS
jgi:hypothetical protein